MKEIEVKVVCVGENECDDDCYVMKVDEFNVKSCMERWFEDMGVWRWDELKDGWNVLEMGNIILVDNIVEKDLKFEFVKIG